MASPGQTRADRAPREPHGDASGDSVPPPGLETLFAGMSHIRAFELAVEQARRDQRLPGLLHLSIGSEATAIGIVSCLGSDDRVYSGHRAHGHFLAAGSDPRQLAAELAGREDGMCRGRAGSMHLMDERAVMATGIVAGTMPIALGHSLRQPDGAVVVVFFGDGAVQTGTFHETMNMAALWRAPVLFVCENNGYAEFSARGEHTTVANVADYGALYRIESATVDGTDVEAVAGVAAALLGPVRAGRGPALLECIVSRLRPHYEGDLRVSTGGPDPLEVAMERLVATGRSRNALEQQREDDITRARALFDEVLTSAPRPDPRDDFSLVFARPVP